MFTILKFFINTIWNSYTQCCNNIKHYDQFYLIIYKILWYDTKLSHSNSGKFPSGYNLFLSAYVFNLINADPNPTKRLNNYDANAPGIAILDNPYLDKAIVVKLSGTELPIAIIVSPR